MKRRNLILLLGGASSGAMIVGTGAFSSMEAERGVSVSVEDDEDAFVGYETPADEEKKSEPITVENDESVRLVTIRNRFSDRTDIGVVGLDINLDNENTGISEVKIKTSPSERSNKQPTTIEVNGTTYDIEDPQATFGPAGKAEVSAEISGISHTDEVDVSITITVKGTGVSARLYGDTRSFKITGERDIASDSSPVYYGGGGRVEIDGDGKGVEVDLYTQPPGKNDTTVEHHEGVSVETGTNIRSEVDGHRIVGVGIDGTIYLHPQWNQETCEFDSPRNGGPGVPGDDPQTCGSD